VPEELIDHAIVGVDDFYLRRPWVPCPGAADALRLLQDAGVGLAIVSNASGTMEEQLASHRICQVGSGDGTEVAVVIDSHVVGVEKPDPRIFGFALEALDVAPERCVFLGDTVVFDVMGARAAGIDAIHVDPYNACPDRDHQHTDSLAHWVSNLLAPP
jgi:putative hydrolase of the HAD superfamily